MGTDNPLRGTGRRGAGHGELIAERSPRGMRLAIAPLTLAIVVAHLRPPSSGLRLTSAGLVTAFLSKRLGCLIALMLLQILSQLAKGMVMLPSGALKEAPVAAQEGSKKTPRAAQEYGTAVTYSWGLTWAAQGRTSAPLGP